MSASGGQSLTPMQQASGSVKIDIDGIIMQLLSVKDTPGKQVIENSLLNLLNQREQNVWTCVHTIRTSNLKLYWYLKDELLLNAFVS